MEPVLEPEISPEDTQPRAPVKAITEPPVSEDDTQPTPPAGSGCGSPLLISIVIFGLIFMFLATVALAAFAGWRDGAQIAQGNKQKTLVAYVDHQATLAHDSLSSGDFELANERCKYIVTEQPFYPGMSECMLTAQAALSATPTPTVTPTPIPPTSTPAPTGDGSDTPESLFARAEEAYRLLDYEKARDLFEALRGKDATYNRDQVESDLVSTYIALGNQYKYEGRLSEMVVVIKAAMKIRSLDNTDWPVTIDAAELYLSAKGYLDAENYTEADKIFIMLMDKYPTFMDVKSLACSAFTSAGDPASFKKYGC